MSGSSDVFDVAFGKVNYYADELYSGDHGQLLSWGWCADYPDPENFADALFHTGSEQNLSNYSNPELDALLEQARVELDVDKRIGMYQQAEQMIVSHVRYFAGEIGGAYQQAINEDRDYIAELKRIDQEVENVRLAQIRALEPAFSQPELAVEVTDDLQIYWQRRYVPEVLEWLQAAKALAQKTNQKQREARARIRSITTLGGVASALSFRAPAAARRRAAAACRRRARARRRGARADLR